MALTKAQIKEILSVAGVSAENVETACAKILDGHLTSINALREKVDEYKAAFEKLPNVQKELDDLKAKGNPDDWQKKFEDEHKAFEDYKTGITNQKAKEQKIALYRELLKECNVEERRIDAVLKVTDFDKFKVKDGKLDDLDKLKENIQSEWSGFIVTENKKGASVDTPPANSGNSGENKKSRAAQLAEEYHRNLYGSEKKGD